MRSRRPVLKLEIDRYRRSEIGGPTISSVQSRGAKRVVAWRQLLTADPLGCKRTYKFSGPKASRGAWRFVAGQTYRYHMRS
jgi:hypothetical protein